MIDVEILNESDEFPCFDGGHHDYRDDGRYIRCGRGCGAELLTVEYEA